MGGRKPLPVQGMLRAWCLERQSGNWISSGSVGHKEGRNGAEAPGMGRFAPVARLSTSKAGAGWDSIPQEDMASSDGSYGGRNS